MKEAETIYARAAAACARVNRDPTSVRVLGACKKQRPETINTFIKYCNGRGERALLGENYVQEWADKRSQLHGEYEVHFIGHLQSNKAKDAAALFNAVESVDSFKLASKLSDAALSNKRTLAVFIQVNISDDSAKSGVPASECISLVQSLANLTNLTLQGLMTIPRLYEHGDAARSDYRALAALGHAVHEVTGQPCELSMGMSHDFEIAIEEGATIVRVGSALFGAR